MDYEVVHEDTQLFRLMCCGKRELSDTDFVEAHSFAEVQDEYLASLGILLK